MVMFMGRRITRFLLLAVGVGIVAVSSLVFMAPSAGASSPTGSPQSQLICSSGGASGGTQSANNYLPANRWSGAISDQHTRLSSGFLGVGDIGQVVQRNVFVGGATAIGASEWKLGINATELASQFCFANSVGNAANSLAGTLGKAIENSGIITLLVVIAIVMAIWRLSRGQQRQWGKVIKLLVIVGIFFALVTAAASAGTKPTSKPPSFSPGGLIDSVYGAVSNLANAPTQAVSQAASNAIGTTHTTTVAHQDPLDCYWYTNELVNKYKSAYGTGGESYSVPLGLNAMWEQAAIPAYTTEQFGSGNNFGSLVYCHLLEDQAGIRPLTQMSIERTTGKTAGFPPTKPSSNAWGGTSSTTVDDSMVAWAACQSPSSAPLTPTEWDLVTGKQLGESEWTMVKNPGQRSGGTQIKSGDCKIWWTVKASTSAGSGSVTTSPFTTGNPSNWTADASNPLKSPFNWSTNSGNITSATNAIETKPEITGVVIPGNGIANYLNTLHGTTNGDAEAMAVVFLLASTVIMVVFLILSAALMIAKLSLLVSMILLPVMLLLALFPGSLASRLPGYLKHLLSLIIFATCAGLLLSLVALITALVADIGVAAGGQGSIVSLIWVAISPIAAVVIIHHFFKRVLKAPSPFTPNAALAYGAAAGGFAGGAGAGLLDMSMMKSMMNRGMQRVRGGSNTSTGPGRRGTRKGGMQPGEGPTGGRSGRGGAGNGPAGGHRGQGGPGGPGDTGNAAAGSRSARTEAAAAAAAERRSANAWGRSPENARTAAGAAVLTGLGGLGAFAKHPAQRTKEFAGRARAAAGRTWRSASDAVDDARPKHATHPKTAAAKTLRGVRVGGRIVRRGAMTAAKGAGKAASAPVRHPVKAVKYGAMGLATVGLMAAPPVAAVAGAAYAAHKIHQVARPRAWRERSADRLTRYRAAQEANEPTEVPNRPTPPSEQGPLRDPPDYGPEDDGPPSYGE